MRERTTRETVGKEIKKMKKLIGYRVYKALTDDNGNIVHKTPIGFAKTMQGARALRVSGGGLTPTIIEEVYSK